MLGWMTVSVAQILQSLASQWDLCFADLVGQDGDWWENLF